MARRMLEFVLKTEHLEKILGFGSTISIINIIYSPHLRQCSIYLDGETLPLMADYSEPVRFCLRDLPEDRMIYLPLVDEEE